MNITAEELKKIAPHAAVNLEEIASAMNYHLPRYNINTEKRVDAFLAQMLHETGGLVWLYELGNKAYFNKYEPNTSIGKRLGNLYSGDGYRYRGRGLIHLTGRTNYKIYGDAIGLDLINKPEIAAMPNPAVQIACKYWSDKNLNNYADVGDMKTITKLINGGYNGLVDRLRYYALLLKTVITT